MPSDPKPSEQRLQSQLLDGWRDGCSPFDALVRYGSSHEAEEFAQIVQHHPWIDRIFVGAAQFLDSTKMKVPDEYKDDLAAAKRRGTRYSELMAQLGEQLFAKLESGELIAIGYAVPRKPTDAPMRVPSDLFEAMTFWPVNDEISGGGLKFVAVRIADNLGRQSPRREPGRPNVRKKVRRACDALGLDKHTIASSPKKIDLFDSVRRKLEQLYPNQNWDTAISNKLLYSVFREIVVE
jgi:hypothetical protein